MNLFALIFSLPFLVCAGLAVLVGILFGRKYKWELSLTRIIVVLVSAVLAALLAALISNLVIGKAVTSLVEGGSLGEIGDMLAELPTGLTAISKLAAMVVAPIIFIPLFIVLRIVLNIVGKVVLKVILNAFEKKGKTERIKKEKKAVERKGIKKSNSVFAVHHANLLGATLGAVCSVLVLCTFLVPLTGALELVDGVVPVALNMAEDADETGVVATISDIVDGSANNAGTLTVKLVGGKALYGLMTTATVDGEMANLNKESALFASLANSTVALVNANEEPDKAGEAIRDISPAFSKSVISRILVTEICSAAGEDWSEGRAYYGLKRPSLGKDFKSLNDATIQVLSTSDKENIKTDVKAFTEAIAVVVEDGLTSDLSGNAMAILSDEKTTSKLFRIFLEDERHVPFVDGVADFGVGMLMDSVQAPQVRAQLYADFVQDFSAIRGTDHDALVIAYADVFDTYGIRVSEDELNRAASAATVDANMTSWLKTNIVADVDDFVSKTEIVSKDMIIEGVPTITDKEHEADALAHAFAVTYQMVADIKGDTFVAKNMLTAMGPALDSFAQTETVGEEKTGLMLAAILQSELVHDQIGFTVLEATDSAKSIKENSGSNSYASVMTSLSGVIEMLEAASDKNKNTKEAVDKMLANLTPEAATVMETMATPNVMKNYGVPERSAASSAQMISTTFGNLKNVPASEYANESGAVADMMNVMMSITENTDNNTPTFGGAESATQITEDEYVNNIMDSTAMSNTVVETVYGEGSSPKVDPLNSQKNLSDIEKAKLVKSLNDKWQASEKDGATKKEIISIAAMMNIKVEVTDDAVVAVENGELE